MTPLLSLSCSGKLNRTVSITLFFPRTLSGHPSRQAVTSSGKRIRPLKWGERKGEKGSVLFSCISRSAGALLASRPLLGDPKRNSRPALDRYSRRQSPRRPKGLCRCKRRQTRISRKIIAGGPAAERNRDQLLVD